MLGGEKSVLIRGEACARKTAPYKREESSIRPRGATSRGSPLSRTEDLAEQRETLKKNDGEEKDSGNNLRKRDEKKTSSLCRKSEISDSSGRGEL